MFAPESSAAADAPWPALDRCCLQKDRRAPPPFPLDVVAPAWRPWIEGHAQASSCVDYIALALLASVSAVCGSRTVVDVTPHWREPLVGRRRAFRRRPVGVELRDATGSRHNAAAFRAG